jgi:hypothetical protein
VHKKTQKCVKKSASFEIYLLFISDTKYLEEKPVLWIRICFSADPDPALYFFVHPDPDPVQTLKSQKVEFLHGK